MKPFAVFDIRPHRAGGAPRRKRPELNLYSAQLAAQGVFYGILPSAGATLRSSNLLLR